MSTSIEATATVSAISSNDQWKDDFLQRVEGINFRRKPSDVVYFIEAVGTGFVKIGLSTSCPGARLIPLQNGCPFELRIIGQIDGDRRTEKALHEKCHKQRVRGEWFRMEGPVLTVMQNLTGRKPQNQQPMTSKESAA